MAVGAADGNEVVPVANRFDRITILEPSDQFVREEVAGVPVRYVKPQMDGTMPFSDAAFDVISCFGTLHHIPNVSKIVCESARVLRPGGHAIIREPIVSMSDWRLHRPGLTKNERGIPIRLMRQFFHDAGLTIAYEKRFGFPLATKLARLLKVSAVRSQFVLAVDSVLSLLFAWNYTYFTTNPLLKLRTTNAIWVVRKISG